MTRHTTSTHDGSKYICRGLPLATLGRSHNAINPTPQTLCKLRATHTVTWIHVCLGSIFTLNPRCQPLNYGLGSVSTCLSQNLSVRSSTFCVCGNASSFLSTVGAFDLHKRRNHLNSILAIRVPVQYEVVRGQFCAVWMLCAGSHFSSVFLFTGQPLRFLLLRV